MIIKYFNNPNLAYSNRKRYRNITLTPFAQETQRAVLLGDGANTSIKTSKNNICNYVMIDNTRWYVTSYVYLNGAQVQLNLQRDVIGEFGIGDVFGKIERGYTNSILKYRKELSLNQVLKKRNYLIPNTNTYGRYTVNTHEKEMWGILYLTKPSDGQDSQTINIPAFAPSVDGDAYIPNNTRYLVSCEPNSYIDYYFRLEGNSGASIDIFIAIRISFLKDSSNQENYIVELTDYRRINSGNEDYLGIIKINQPYSYVDANATLIARYIGELLKFTPRGYNLSDLLPINNDIPNYNEKVLEYNNSYIKYTQKNIIDISYGSYNVPTMGNEIEEVLDGKFLFDAGTAGGINYGAVNTVYCIIPHPTYTIYPETLSRLTYSLLTYDELSDEEAGNIVLNFNEDVVNEPFFILAFPLYNVIITKNEERYAINKDRAFNIFNTVIQYLSGESGYIIDAQIYPYCPNLIKVASELQGYPFFNISASNYDHDCIVQLQPYTDVKKEYIKREYSIIAPDQSAKFDFNFYDYINKFDDNNGINFASMTVKVRTSLKPFSIISAAVIKPTDNALKAFYYNSDLRGCKPSSGGFECSLASNEYQTYLRNNSNYQQIFAKQQESLQKQHQVEHNNEVASSVMNSLSATAMGAIGGAAMGDAGIWGDMVGSKGIGAVAGAAVAGSVVSGMMAWQTIENDKLRNYEYNLQQEMFDLQIGTIKNLPNSINRISSFNEIILNDFWFTIETYECTEYESEIVDTFIQSYSYLIGVYDYVSNYVNEGWFVRAKIISSSYAVNLSVIADTELKGGVYIYEQI